MVKKGYFFLGILFSFYLLLPGPTLPPPNLPDSFQSDEPGDTYQISKVSAYYTQKERKEVISFYEEYFSRSSFLNFPLLVYRLNHPPEYARQIWVDTKQSFYLEEIVDPLRGSLFVNGYEWEKDVFTPPSARKQYRLIAGGQEWPSKVSLRWFPSRGLTRLVIFWLIWIVFWVLLNLWKRELCVLGKMRNFWRKRKND